ncbi:phosphatase 2C, partial [Thraustotheca clavata]
AISYAFFDTDEQLKSILYPAFNLGFGNVNRIGSCAMLAYTYADTLVIANAGDIRAVLATRDEETNILKATPLSQDHNAKLEREQVKLIKEHPGEEDIVMCRHKEACYVKGGLQPTRAFGDFAFKDKNFNGSPFPERRSGGRYFAAPYTPPYISSLPEVETHQLTPSDQFLILGSDGVWEFLTNQEAVDLVNYYISLGHQDLASQGLVHHVINRAASEAGMTFDEMTALPAGRKRRNRHDDTTVVILFFG